MKQGSTIYYLHSDHLGGVAMSTAGGTTPEQYVGLQCLWQLSLWRRHPDRPQVHRAEAGCRNGVVLL
ncbi:MAG: hypothetical protein R2932_22030 [Caldilineaceae bacterium]